MSAKYVTVQWNRQKRVYDLLISGAVGVYLTVFVAGSRVLWQGEHAIDASVTLIRATGTCAILLLHIILCIGPLARLDQRFAALLYNRRHLGVTMFLVALTHGLLVLGYYHAYGKVNPLVSLLTFDNSWTHPESLPFQILGLAALVILFFMASTSHDFWLKNLSPRWWKSLHMLVYVAYFLIVMHVTLGALRAETSRTYPTVLLTGMILVCSLHIAAGLRQHGRDRRAWRSFEEWVDVCDLSEIPEARAKGVRLGRDTVAVFKHKGRISAVAGACVHQGGPLAEGKIIGGCITCPWHGYQYRPGDGCSPPPFREKLHTYQVRIRGNRVELHTRKNAPGTPVEPAGIETQEAAHA